MSNKLQIGDIHPGTGGQYVPGKSEGSSMLLAIFCLSCFLSIIAFLTAVIAVCK